MSRHMGIPPESLLYSATTFHNLAIAADPGRVRRQVIEDLRQHAATALVQSEKVTEHRGDYQTTYRLEVYVLSPDQLGRMVQEEAQRLNTMCNTPVRLADFTVKLPTFPDFPTSMERELQEAFTKAVKDAGGRVEP